jgi:hypothetical protein
MADPSLELKKLQRAKSRELVLRLRRMGFVLSVSTKYPENIPMVAILGTTRLTAADRASINAVYTEIAANEEGTLLYPTYTVTEPQ